MREYEYVSGIDDRLEDGEMFGNATIAGKMVFQVGKDETDFTLISREFLGMEKAYLALP